MQQIYARPKVLKDTYMKYCGGCGHSLVNKMIAEIIDEKNLREKTVIVWPIGCSVYGDQYFNVDQICALHGRAPAVATGIKRSLPDNNVLVYQGDGDMVSEGIAEIMHSAIRGENFTVVFINNAIYGMTGGQMAPTTLEGQKTTTSPYGRNHNVAGYPVNMAEIMANMPGCYYSERVTVTDPKNAVNCKRAIAKAFELQKEARGLTFVEVLSPCPTGWGMKPVDALKWIDGTMTRQYPLGVFKDASAGGKQA